MKRVHAHGSIMECRCDSPPKKFGGVAGPRGPRNESYRYPPATVEKEIGPMRAECLHGFDEDTCPLEHAYPSVVYPATGSLWRRFWARLRLKVRAVRRL